VYKILFNGILLATHFNCAYFQISKQSAHEGDKVVSPAHRPPLPPQEIFLVFISVRK